MNAVRFLAFGLLAVVLIAPCSFAADDAAPAKTEVSGPAVDAVKAEIKERSKVSGTLDIFDSKIEKVRTLSLMSIKEAAADKVTAEFRDTKAGDVVTVEVVLGEGNKVGDFNILSAEPPQPVAAAKKDYTDQEVSDYIKEYIATQAAGTGVFLMYDESSQKMLRLKFVSLQEKVRRYGIIAISTAEFTEQDTNNTVIADVNVENKEGLNVTAIRIKSVVKAAAPAADAVAK